MRYDLLKTDAEREEFKKSENFWVACRLDSGDTIFWSVESVDINDDAEVEFDKDGKFSYCAYDTNEYYLFNDEDEANLLVAEKEYEIAQKEFDEAQKEMSRLEKQIKKYQKKIKSKEIKGA